MRYRIRSALITITAAMLLGSGAALAASNACKADLTGDGVVNFADLAVLKSVFFQRCNDPGPTCGDGLAQGPTEQCDDGNVLDGDGCSETCTIEVPPSPGPSYAFPATGQTTCWDPADTTVPISTIACPGTRQDGEIQAGATLAYVDNGNGTITDSNTGLMWEKLSDDGAIHDRDTTYTWANAFTVKIATLNGGAGFAARTDWRMPNKKELESIVNAEVFNPTLSPAFNTGCVPGATVLTGSCTKSSFYWSSTSNAFDPSKAWRVGFDFGAVTAGFKADALYVRAVRGGL